MDVQIGRILDSLEESGLPTAPMYSTPPITDWGSAIMAARQANLYEHSTRVPFIVQGPGIPKGKQVEAPIYLQGVMATRCPCRIGQTQARGIQDILPLARGETKKSPYNEIYGAYLSAQRSITVKNLKLIVYPDVPIMRVYDLAKDPFRTTWLRRPKA